MTVTNDMAVGSISVRRLQEGLNALGYRSDDGRELATDGELGPRTRSATLRFQSERMHEPPTDGMIGPRTMIALARYAEYLDSLDDIRHPCHAMYSSTMDGVSRLPPPCPTDETQRANLGAALTVAASKAGMDNVDHVIASENGNRVFAVQGSLDSPLKRMVEVNVREAVETPAQVSRDDLAQHAVSAMGEPAHDMSVAVPDVYVHAAREPHR